MSILLNANNFNHLQTLKHDLCTVRACLTLICTAISQLSLSGSNLNFLFGLKQPTLKYGLCIARARLSFTCSANVSMVAEQNLLKC